MSNDSYRRIKCGAGYELELEDEVVELTPKIFEFQYIDFIIDGLERLRMEVNIEACKKLSHLTCVLENDFYEFTTFSFMNNDKWGKIFVSNINGEMHYKLSGMPLPYYIKSNQLIETYNKIMEYIK